MNYPVLKVSALTLTASVVLHAAAGWVTVSGNFRRAQSGVTEGRGGAAGRAARRVLQAEVRLSAPQTPAPPQARNGRDELPQVPEPDTESPLTAASSPSAQPNPAPRDLPVSPAARHHPLTVSAPPSIGAPGTLAVKIPAAGDGGVKTSAPAAYLHNPPPVYPAGARARGQEGRVLLGVTVSARGLVSAARVKKSSGFPALDEAALTAVKQWKFRPATKNGGDVADTFDQPVVFSLKK
ncbi:MAG: energy transducer TonB [Verrucomicrobiales bacterium]|jgi:protein TonB|nr:energy transducer TonB [Verrucomicrobiales bacterium]